MISASRMGGGRQEGRDTQPSRRSRPSRTRSRSATSPTWSCWPASAPARCSSCRRTRPSSGRGPRSASASTTTASRASTAQFVRDGDKMILEDLGSTNGTFCNGIRVDRRELVDGDKIMVGSTTILKFTYHDYLDEIFQRQMYESALRDGLTKVFNKKYFTDYLEKEFAFAARHGGPLALIFLDIDHFKKINDTHGHPAGDFVLAELSQMMATLLRTEDVLARFGGEEFAVICRGSDLVGREDRRRAPAQGGRGAQVHLRRQGHPGDDQPRRRRDPGERHQRPQRVPGRGRQGALRGQAQRPQPRLRARPRRRRRSRRRARRTSSGRTETGNRRPTGDRQRAIPDPTLPVAVAGRRLPVSGQRRRTNARSAATRNPSAPT